MKLRKSLLCFPATNKYNKKKSSELREKLCKFELWKNFSKIASLHCKIKEQDDEAKSQLQFSQLRTFRMNFRQIFFVFFNCTQNGNWSTLEKIVGKKIKFIFKLHEWTAAGAAHKKVRNAMESNLFNVQQLKLRLFPDFPLSHTCAPWYQVENDLLIKIHFISSSIIELVKFTFVERVERRRRRRKKEELKRIFC